MAANQEIRASKEVIENFVAKLKMVPSCLSKVEQATLVTKLEGAQLGELSGHVGPTYDE